VFQTISNIPDDETRELCDRLIRRCHGKDQQSHTDQPSRKEKLMFFKQYKIFLALGVAALGLVGIIFLLTKNNPSQPQPMGTKTLTNSPVISPSPTNAPTPAVAPPKLISITAATLQAKYAEGQRDFRYVQLTGIQGDRLQRHDFSNINLSGSVLERVDLRQVIFKNANLNGIKIVKVDLRGADLSNASLVDANLAFSNLAEANLSQANLLAILDEANLSASDLRSAELHLTNLSNANLSLANLTASKLILIEFAGTNFNGANFRNAIVDNIGSIEAADFTNVVNLAPNIRQYFCSLASGNAAETGISTKSTLNCLP